jgi:hypothetical protein
MISIAMQLKTTLVGIFAAVLEYIGLESGSEVLLEDGSPMVREG